MSDNDTLAAQASADILSESPTPDLDTHEESESRRRGLSFDGFGINGPDDYASRVATFANDEAARFYGPIFARAMETVRERDEARAERDNAREALTNHEAVGPVTRRMLESSAADLATAKRAVVMANDIAARAREGQDRMRAELDQANAAADRYVNTQEALEALEEKHAALVGAVRAAMVLAEGSGPV